METLTLEQFVTDNSITMKCKRTDRNPLMSGSGNMDHWKCTLCLGTYRVRMTLVFSQGKGHNGAVPDVASVLNCLSSDSSSVDSRSFEEWSDDMGYDSDSRLCERTYKACQRQAARLRKFLGDNLYSTLLFNTEAQ